MPDTALTEKDVEDRARTAGHDLRGGSARWQYYRESWGDQFVHVLWCYVCDVPLAVDVADRCFALCADDPCSGHR